MARKMRKFSAGGAQGRYDRRMADIEKDYKKAMTRKTGKAAEVAEAKRQQRIADAKDDLAKRTGADRTATRAAEKAAEANLTKTRKFGADKPAAAAEPAKTTAPAAAAAAAAAAPTAEKAKAKPQSFGAAFQAARAKAIKEGRDPNKEIFTWGGKKKVALMATTPKPAQRSTNTTANNRPTTTAATAATTTTTPKPAATTTTTTPKPATTASVTSTTYASPTLLQMMRADTEAKKKADKAKADKAKADEAKAKQARAAATKAAMVRGPMRSVLKPEEKPKLKVVTPEQRKAYDTALLKTKLAKGGKAKTMKYRSGGSTPPQPTAAERKADAKFRESIKNLKVTPEQAAAIGRGNRSEASTAKPKKYAAGGVTKEMPSSKAMGSMNMAKGGKAKVKAKAKGNPFAATKFGAAMKKKSADTKGRAMMKFAKGGSIDGCAIKGKTKTSMVKMKKGGKTC